MTHGKKSLTIRQMLSIFIKHWWKDESYQRAFLKCDEKGCTHIEFHWEIEAEQIGKPCPRCGASLLTKEDYLDGRS